MKYYVVDAFADKLFAGNPAGVCMPNKALSEAQMQSIAFENNLAETAFLSKRDDGYNLRWFTPKTEIDLCGHATLACAFVLMTTGQADTHQIAFHTQSGVLRVSRDGDIYTLDFPSRPPVACAVPEGLREALGARVIETHKSRDLVVVLESEAVVAALRPDFALLGRLDMGFAVIVTARGEKHDFVSRFFAPGAGIDEDPVTGSSHCTLIPFWSQRLGKRHMSAAQLSQRGGVLYCADEGERVKIGGKAVLYLSGEIQMED